MPQNITSLFNVFITATCLYQTKLYRLTICRYKAGLVFLRLEHNIVLKIERRSFGIPNIHNRLYGKQVSSLEKFKVQVSNSFCTELTLNVLPTHPFNCVFKFIVKINFLLNIHTKPNGNNVEIISSSNLYLQS